jgi:hypothetical protein
MLFTLFLFAALTALCVSFVDRKRWLMTWPSC